MKFSAVHYWTIVLITFGGFSLKAQKPADTVQLQLAQVVEMAKENSIAAKQAVTLKETRYWEYRSYRSNYKPQLTLNGTLPTFTRSFNQIVQPNGSIEFQPVRNNNSHLNLSFSQSIAPTGGIIFGTTLLQRFDDFDRDLTLYNGVPYALGYSQPLFVFNALRWDKKIEPLKYEESKREYIEAMEETSITAGELFFELLVAQVNLQISDTNFNNTTTILRIANEKFDMGKISRNEILQLQLELLKAKKAVASARRDMEVAMLNLKSFIGMGGEQKIKLVLPPAAINMQVTADKVLTEALTNRSDAVAYRRRLEEATRDVAKAKGENSLNATLTARVGFANSAQTVSKIYQSPQNQQLFQLEFDIPILDWGRSKSKLKTAQANKKFIEYAVEQDQLSFRQEIFTEVTLFEMLRDQLQLTAQADSIATEKYGIAKERYILGRLSITDLSVAFQDKDRARQDYILALRDFWVAYYRLRYLSLYDFERGEKIGYE